MSGVPARPPHLPAGGHAVPHPADVDLRQRYLWLLGWAFSILSTARLLSYLPTLWAICASRDSSQHSLWTWGIWLGSNLTMALWLYEEHGQRWSRAAAVNVVNATMCAATFTVILVFRF